MDLMQRRRELAEAQLKAMQSLGFIQGQLVLLEELERDMSALPREDLPPDA